MVNWWFVFVLFIIFIVAVAGHMLLLARDVNRIAHNVQRDGWTKVSWEELSFLFKAPFWRWYVRRYYPKLDAHARLEEQQ